MSDKVQEDMEAYLGSNELREVFWKRFTELHIFGETKFNAKRHFLEFRRSRYNHKSRGK